MKVNNLVWQHELSLQLNQNIAENITNCWSSPDGRRSDLLPSIRVWLGCYETHLQSHLSYSDLNAHCIVQQGRGQFVKSFIYQELLVIKDNTWLTILCLHGGRFLIISYIYRIPTTPPNLKDWYITYVPVQLCMRVRFSVNNKWLCVYDKSPNLSNLYKTLMKN